MVQNIKNNPAIIASCVCVNPEQDKLYGKGMRVKNGTRNGVRCTVCRSTTGLKSNAGVI